MQEKLEEIAITHSDCRTAVGIVIVGFASLVQEGANSRVNFGLTKSAVLVENILGGVTGGIFLWKVTNAGQS